MPVDLSEILVIGVSTRALFNLEKENEVFDKEGIEFIDSLCNMLKKPTRK